MEALPQPIGIERIGEYQLVHFVGAGGMAEVWSAVRRSTSGVYAIKVMLPELSRQPKHVEMFQREATIAAQLGRHAGIVRVHESGMSEGLLYLVMDLVDGVNLQRFLKEWTRKVREPLPLRLVVYVVQSMLRALRAAHEHTIASRPAGVVHSDVKPANVLVSSAGEIQLSDFGIAKFAALTPWVSKPVGTLRYMAPEQYLGKVSTCSDLYSAGAVLHELLTGDAPSPKTTDPREFQRALMMDPVPGTGRDDVPQALERLRVGLLDKHDARRIPTAEVALEILEPLVAGDPQTELMRVYERIIGPPRSGLTRYLQHCADAPPSFLVQLARPLPIAVPAVPVDREAVTNTADPPVRPDVASLEDEDAPTRRRPSLDDPTPGRERTQRLDDGIGVVARKVEHAPRIDTSAGPRGGSVWRSPTALFMLFFVFGVAISLALGLALWSTVGGAP